MIHTTNEKSSKMKGDEVSLTLIPAEIRSSLRGELITSLLLDSVAPFDAEEPDFIMTDRRQNKKRTSVTEIHRKETKSEEEKSKRKKKHAKEVKKIFSP